jgi:hypothetical protein
VIPQRTPLWSSGRSSWLQIQRSGFGSRRYQFLWEVVGLERGPLSLESTTEELLGRKSSGCGLETENTAVAIYLSAMVRTNFADKRRSLGRYSRWRTQATEFSFYVRFMRLSFRFAVGVAPASMVRQLLQSSICWKSQSQFSCSCVKVSFPRSKRCCYYRLLITVLVISSGCFLPFTKRLLQRSVCVQSKKVKLSP